MPSVVRQSVCLPFRRLGLSLRRRWRTCLLVAGLLLAVLGGGWIWLRSRCRWDDAALLSRPYSTVFRDRQGGVLQVSLSSRQEWRFRVSLEEVSPRLLDALIAVEDQRFRAHGGVDWRAVARAAVANARAGRILSGASTISMQVVRLSRPDGRGWGDKLRQAMLALDLETRHDKDWILEQYLNLLPFGGNVVGVEAAAMRYFGKRAKDLTLAEAALLAGMPQRPNQFRPDRFPDEARRRRSYVLQRMVREGMLAANEAVDAAEQALPVLARTGDSRMGLPPREPQFCQLVAARQPAPGACVRTTLDPQAQEQALAALREGVARCQDVADGAVVVLDVPTGEVRALVGTLDYSRPGDGQVNAAVAPRSPGSALKPFLYAAAIEGGTMVPETILEDSPISLPDYRPGNYDQRYRGRVSMADALRDSLNTPAVRVLLDTGVPRALDLLRKCGIASLDRPAEEYGLALALGGGEVTALELAAAYSVLARGGLWIPPRLVLGEDTCSPRRVLAPGVASLVNSVLSERPLPGLVGVRMAWKTGTSNGLRDAWCAAYSGSTVIVVWIGNKSGAAAPSLVGIRAAVPVAADLATRLLAGGGTVPPVVSQDLVEVALCAATGLRAGPSCARRKKGLRPEGVPLLACSECRSAAVGAPEPPRIAILSPRPGVYRASGTGGIELPLRATATGALSWFVDGRLVADSGMQGFAVGRHTVSCVAGDGASADSVVLDVRASR